LAVSNLTGLRDLSGLSNYLVVAVSNLTGLRDLSGLSNYLVHDYQIFQKGRFEKLVKLITDLG